GSCVSRIRERRRVMVHPYYTATDPFSVETSRGGAVQRAHARAHRRGAPPEEIGADPAPRPDDGAAQDRLRRLDPLRRRGRRQDLVPLDQARIRAAAPRAGRGPAHHLSRGGVREGDRGRLRGLPAPGHRRDDGPAAAAPQVGPLQRRRDEEAAPGGRHPVARPPRAAVRAAAEAARPLRRRADDIIRPLRQPGWGVSLAWLIPPPDGSSKPWSPPRSRTATSPTPRRPSSKTRPSAWAS